METGGEFRDIPLTEKPNTPFPGNVRHTLSGRTALELAARDLMAERGARSVYLPAYCCDSMTEPFKRLGYRIRFYAVEPYSKTVHRQIFSDHGCDVILLTDYFGFASEETALFAEIESLRGTAVILDCVQSEFTPTRARDFADYLIFSHRKWFFSNAAAAVKCHGTWQAPEYTRVNEEYIRLRRTAAALKSAYIERGEGEKAKYLAMYGRAECLLDEDFSGYGPEEKSLEELKFVDADYIISRRRENAERLLAGLERMPRNIIRPLYSRLGEDDVPLFVPVLVKKELRQSLRQHMMANEVYCPVHWPSELGGANILYDCELSLICDQRYGAEEMDRQLGLISAFLNAGAQRQSEMKSILPSLPDTASEEENGG